MTLKGRPVRFRLLQPEVERQAGHAVDAAVPRGDQGHLGALLCQGQSFSAAIPFAGELTLPTQLMGFP